MWSDSVWPKFQIPTYALPTMESKRSYINLGELFITTNEKTKYPKNGLILPQMMLAFLQITSISSDGRKYVNFWPLQHPRSTQQINSDPLRDFKKEIHLVNDLICWLSDETPHRYSNQFRHDVQIIWNHEKDVREMEKASIITVRKPLDFIGIHSLLMCPICKDSWWNKCNEKCFVH